MRNSLSGDPVRTCVSAAALKDPPPGRPNGAGAAAADAWSTLRAATGHQSAAVSCRFCACGVWGGLGALWHSGPPLSSDKEVRSTGLHSPRTMAGGMTRHKASSCSRRGHGSAAPRTSPCPQVDHAVRPDGAVSDLLLLEHRSLWASGGTPWDRQTSAAGRVHRMRIRWLGSCACRTMCLSIRRAAPTLGTTCDQEQVSKFIIESGSLHPFSLFCLLCASVS